MAQLSSAPTDAKAPFDGQARVMKTAGSRAQNSVRHWGLYPLVSLISGCSPISTGFLNPAGPIAASQRELFFWVIGLTLIVVVPVIVLTPWLLWRYRWRQRRAAYRPRWDFSLPIDCFTWGVPVLVVIGLGGLTWQRTHQLDPYRPLPGTEPPVQVQVVALDWKWLFVYPQLGIATLNELVIPSGRPVHLSLTSDTVMQSLLIGQLSGQIYAMPGMRTQQYLQADKDGTYIGRNTQFNGARFQQQHFPVRAISPQAFAQWSSTAQQSSAVLDCERYRSLGKDPSLVSAQTWRVTEPALFNEVIDAFRMPVTPACGSSAKEARHD
jgi:cytochrome o ubiquinol oxidase subunit 2